MTFWILECGSHCAAAFWACNQRLPRGWWQQTFALWLSEVSRMWFSTSRCGASWLPLGVRQRVPPHSTPSRFLKWQPLSGEETEHTFSLLHRAELNSLMRFGILRREICWGVNATGLFTWQINKTMIITY